MSAVTELISTLFRKYILLTLMFLLLHFSPLFCTFMTITVRKVHHSYVQALETLTLALKFNAHL